MAAETPLPQAIAMMIDALGDPNVRDGTIEELSARLQPYGRFDPAAFGVFGMVAQPTGEPLCGGLADVPKIAQMVSRDQPTLRAKRGYLDMFWVGTAKGLAIVLPVSAQAYFWSWQSIAAIEPGRRAGKFGSVRIGFDTGDRVKVRVPASQVELILALFRRFGRDGAESSGAL